VIGRHPAPITRGGRCVSAGRRTLFTCGFDPLVPGGAIARRRGAEFFVAPPDPWQDAAHDDVAKARHAPGSLLLVLIASHARNVAHGEINVRAIGYPSKSGRASHYQSGNRCPESAVNGD
jgi:hypothetical protein